MARVTRSTTQRQGDLILNDVNSAADSFQSILHDVPFSETTREVLGEITPNTEDTTAPPTLPKDPVDVELKGLKAAFRSAIGMKKRKKPRKPKNCEGTSIAETLDNLSTEVVADDSTMASMIVETSYYPQQYFGQDVTTLDGRNVELAAAPDSGTLRMTRQQLAKQPHSGQSEQGISFQDGPGFHPGAYHDPRSFSAHLISNLTDSQFEIYRTLEMANHSINLADGVRREIEGIINIPEMKRYLRQQPIPEANNILAERDVKMLSPVDDKAPTTTFHVPARVTEPPSTPNKIMDSDDDSFAKVITSRSPAKPVSRVDYVDELDKIEDVMDALDEATSPNVKATSPGKIAFLSGKHGSFYGGEHLSRIISPTDVELAKLRKDGLLEPNSTLRKSRSMHFETNSRTATQSTQDLARPSSSSAESTRPITAPTVQATTPDLSRSSSKTTETRRSVVNKRPAVVSPRKQPVKSAKPPTRPAFELPGEAVSRKLREQREARRAQRESEDVDSRAGSVAPRFRSAKTPTKPAFELPGEAISRRKREAHELRLKKQGEEEKKRREFKAKPSRCSFLATAVVKETAASRARSGIDALNDVSNDAKDNASIGKQANSLNVSKRASTISRGHTRRPLLSPQDSNPSSSNPRLPAAALNHRNLTPHTSIVGTARPAPTTTSMTGLSSQRSTSVRKVSNNLRGKEIYQRQEKAMAEMQREKKEKEEAAKRSRGWAAEQGRQASREWAEKQKAKAKKDVGLETGFGPGGQIGLK